MGRCLRSAACCSPADIKTGLCEPGRGAARLEAPTVRELAAACFQQAAQLARSLARLPAAGGYAANLLPAMLLFGGFGLAVPAMITLAMSAASASDAGVTSGLASTTEQVGAALGVAVPSTIAAARATHLAAGATAAGR